MSTAPSSSTQNRVYLITGAASGVGRAQALALAQLGAVVALADVNAVDEVASEVAKLGGQCMALPMDIRDAAAVGGGMNEVLREFGRLDGVCATAGVCRGYGPFWGIDDEDMRFTMETNVYGTWNVLAAAAKHWVTTSRGGAVVVTGSIAGVRGLSSVGHYVMSKHAQLGLVRTAARELGPYGVRVNAVAPTNVNTPMFQREAVWQIVTDGAGPPSREEAARAALADHHLPISWVEPQDVAAATIWLLSDSARYVTGVVLPVDGGALDH